MTILEFGLLGIFIWFIATFYWLRILSCGLLLTLWGITVIAAPIYFTFIHINEGNWVAAIGMVVLIMFYGGALWWIAASAAFNWVRKEKAEGGFRQPWNTR